ncbi:uncharacterized protein LOC130591060 [Beta vulgaris subsp. vulgaris]|uniref:uncharacterized protein LOC130591060 n=1 Tax=Beta vulgaris subsp. vulgaris TaxID=3555 RepID=UPI002547EC05|nr:uncharacterized protein LOC130591060 [Beta vulgaris subsp. vulgaris]
MEYAIKFEFLGSNNEAEYEALILGLQLCILAGATTIEARSDSQLIVGQVSGEYEAKEDNMRMYLAKAQEFIKKLSHFHISHIPRSENQQADALARMASSAEGSAPRTIMWEVLRQPSINAKEQLILDRTSTWTDEVVGFRDGILPAESRKPKGSSTEQGNTPRGVWQPPRRENYSWESSKGGYYWPTLKADAQELVKRCPSPDPFGYSQSPSHPPHLHSSNTAIRQMGHGSTWPLPPASGQRKFLIVAIDYFTKWTEAEPLAPSLTKVQAFIWRNIITRFRVPRALVSDNGRQFNSGPTRDYCARFGIQTRFSAVSRPQTNGQAEAANKIVLKEIKKSLDAAKGDWVDDLPGVLWSARTTTKEATGHSPVRFGIW